MNYNNDADYEVVDRAETENVYNRLVDKGIILLQR